MKANRDRFGWVCRLMAAPALVLFLTTACATTTVVVATPPPAAQSDDDDFSDLIAQLRADLNCYNARHVEKAPTLTATAETKKERDTQFAARAKALFAPLNGASLLMPVVGVQTFNLSNSWGDSRDGGKRRHKGIDIFAPKGTGQSFYYAHLDRWASGLYEGMEVRSGDLLGYVGNTGNAKTTPSHLHFGVNDNDEMVNPYPLLTKAVPVRHARVAVESAGAALGTR